MDLDVLLPLTSFSQLTFFDFQGCGLTGTLSPLWGELDKLTYLDLSRNNITGSLPTWRNLRSLELMTLSNNKISGSLPASWGEGLFMSMKQLSLQKNLIDGDIPGQ